MALIDTLCAAEHVKTVDEIFVVRSPEQVQKLFDLGFYKDRKIPKSIQKKAFELYFNQHHDSLKILLTSLLSEQSYFLDRAKPVFPKSMVIWGDQDDVFPMTEGEKLAEYMNAEFVAIPKAGHAANVEGYKLFEKHFRRFLQKSGN